MNSTIDFDIFLKEDQSYGYAQAKTKNTIAARAATWKSRLGARVATNFGDITKKSSLHFSQTVVPIKSDGSTPANPGNGGNGGGNDEGDVIG